MTAVATHPGGPFYVWYVSVYGYGPPATVDSNAARYLAWQQGMPKALAAGIPYGSIGPPGEFVVGQALLAPVLVTTPASPTPIVAPAATLTEAGVTVVAPFASPAPAGPAAGGSAPTATTAVWYAVVASAELPGGEGACRAIQSRGYSELSTDPNASNLDFAALGSLPCLTGLYIRNPANGQEVGAVKQDVGAGSSFHPNMGLYPQTVDDLGLDSSAGEFHVYVQRQDGKPMNIPGATVVNLSSNGSAATPTGTTGGAFYNPLEHASVTSERIDQGVDYAGTGYLVAVADGVVTISTQDDPGWEGGGYVQYRVTQGGFLDGAYIYYAEGVSPVVSVGEKVRGGARIADLRVPQPTGIEIGFAAGNGDESYYAYHDGGWNDTLDSESAATRPGLAFSNLIKALGGPPGKIEGPVVGKFPEYMPSGEPPADMGAGSGTAGILSSGAGNVSASTAASDFGFPDAIYSAFVQIQRGADNGSHHSHSAQQFINGITYVPQAS
jgi:hypothetical protein